MAYKKRRKRDRNFVAIPITGNLALGALADLTVIEDTILGSLSEDLQVISIDAVWSVNNMTSGEKPITVGFAHGDYSVTEVKEYLEANITNPDDLVAYERIRRKIRRVGSAGMALETDEVLNAGMSIKTPARFVVGSGNTLKAFAYNRSGSVLTTGGYVRWDGMLYGRWLR